MEQLNQLALQVWTVSWRGSRESVSYDDSKTKTWLNKLSQSALKRHFEVRGVYQLREDCGDEAIRWQPVEDVEFKENAHYILTTLGTPLQEEVRPIACALLGRWQVPDSACI